MSALIRLTCLQGNRWVLQNNLQEILIMSMRDNFVLFPVKKHCRGICVLSPQQMDF